MSACPLNARCVSLYGKSYDALVDDVMKKRRELAAAPQKRAPSPLAETDAEAELSAKKPEPAPSPPKDDVEDEARPASPDPIEESIASITRLAHGMSLLKVGNAAQERPLTPLNELYARHYNDLVDRQHWQGPLLESQKRHVLTVATVTFSYDAIVYTVDIYRDGSLDASPENHWRFEKSWPLWQGDGTADSHWAHSSIVELVEVMMNRMYGVNIRSEDPK
jgi:hypothetical protein